MDPLYAAWAELNWLSVSRYQKIKELYGDLETAWKKITAGDLEFMGEDADRAEEFLMRKKDINPEEVVVKLKKESVQLLFFEDENYPRMLKKISTPPVFLYMKGEWKEAHDTALAVVGTRAITSYGKRACESLIADLGSQLTIVSGLAYGIDSVAHESCLKYGFQTIAVLGNGLDEVYPPRNAALAQKILDAGGVLLSEFPFATEPNAYNFPRRNRIISGLSLGTLVIEGKRKSGSLITARYALEQNREVFAVPGDIFSAPAAGCNYLIQSGQAKLVSSAADILEELSLETVEMQQEVQRAIHFSSDEEQCVYHALKSDAKDVSSLSSELDLATAKILSCLTLLEMKGLASTLGSGLWVKA